ncbi:HAMP domain-containing sensor histidine kinase [Paenibacillus sp. HB172176]|uniref:sensor histidine kinase n=1 Tax=Paenibacillus sp. HB172176 TaxID=2493690 RepID=UPI00143A178E|nr:HAMP domain-containing sensor histidine kinase [Paenibacillus sp. HB172176]
MKRGSRFIQTLQRFIQPQSLRLQLLSRTLLLMAALLLLIGSLQFVFMRDFLYRNKSEALNAQIMSLPPDILRNSDGDNASDHSRPDMDGNEEHGLSPTPVQFQPGLTIAIVHEDGSLSQINASHSDEAAPPALSREEYIQIESNLERQKHVPYRLLDDASGSRKLVVFRLVGHPGKDDNPILIQASMETDSLRKQLLAQVSLYAALSLAALLSGLALYLPLLRRTLKPLSKAVEAARLTDAGNLTTRIPEHQGQQEIDSLSEAFNSMLMRLNTSFEKERNMTNAMRRFVADASHELRTPLTSIQGFIEVLLRGAAANPEQLRRALTSMNEESSRIRKLVEDLLQLAKLDQSPQLQLQPLNLTQLIQEMEPQLQVLGGRRSLQLQLVKDATIRANADKLKQVILNLFQNAVQHTDPSQGKISLTLKAERSSVELVIEDNGSGIKEEHLPHIFERFYRGDASRARLSGGSGLGLAISKSIVESHEGVLTIESREQEGTLCRLRLPAIS